MIFRKQELVQTSKRPSKCLLKDLGLKAFMGQSSNGSAYKETWSWFLRCKRDIWLGFKENSRGWITR